MFLFSVTQAALECAAVLLSFSGLRLQAMVLATVCATLHFPMLVMYFKENKMGVVMLPAMLGSRKLKD